MSTHKLVEKLQAERSALEGQVRDLIEAAEESGSDLSDDDLTTIRSAKDRMAEIDTRVETIADDFSQRYEVATKVSKLGQLDSSTDFQYRSAGDAVIDLIKQHRDPDARRRVQLAERAATHMGTTKAGTTAEAGGFDGLVFVPNVGAVIYPLPEAMPWLSLIGLRRMPTASFNRLYVDDPHWSDGVGPQAGDKEKGELPTKPFDVKAETLSPATLGGYLNVSRQAEELVPGSLDLVIRVLRARLARAMEAALVTEVAKSTGSVSLAADADAAATIKAIYDAAAAYTKVTGEPATWIAMGPDGFAQIGGLADLAGRPLFPYLGAANAPGTSTANRFTSAVAGLTPVVSQAITGTTLYVGGASAVEPWFYPLPVLEAVEPSVLGRQVAVAALFAAHRPAPYVNAIQVVAAP